MNINGVYIVPIYVKTLEKNLGKHLIESNGKFVKYALVYKDKNSDKSTFIDLETKEKYDVHNVEDAIVGELYISLKQGLLPLADINRSRKNNPF